MTERQRLPKLVENNVVSIKKEMNGIIEEILKENKIDITDLNHLIYAAASVIMEEVIKPGKAVKSRQNKNSWKIIQRKINIWRKELSILSESDPGPHNFK
jgi:chorismate mutase